MTDAQMATGTGTRRRLVVISSGAIEIRPMSVKYLPLAVPVGQLPM